MKGVRLSSGKVVTEEFTPWFSKDYVLPSLTSLTYPSLKPPDISFYMNVPFHKFSGTTDQAHLMVGVRKNQSYMSYENNFYVTCTKNVLNKAIVKYGINFTPCCCNNNIITNTVINKYANVIQHTYTECMEIK